MCIRDSFLGALFASAIEAADHWIAFALLGFIGANMLKEAFEQDNAESCSDEVNGDLSARIMFVMAVATSIDALAAGISLAMAGGIRILPTVAVIGITTFILSAAGVKVGNIFGSRFEKKAQMCIRDRIWAGKYIGIRKGRFLTSGGLGTMGYSLPAGIGLSLIHI